MVPLMAEDIKEVRRDLENYLYSTWSQASQTRPAVERELRAILEQHAQAVMYVILRKADPDLLTEAVDKVMLNLETFRGESLFTTWAHRIMMGVMYDQRRLERRRREVPLDIPGFDLAGPPSPEMTDLLLTLRKLLSPADYLILEELAIQGKTQQEVAASLRLSQPTLSRRWARITRTICHAFAK